MENEKNVDFKKKAVMNYAADNKNYNLHKIREITRKRD